MYTGEFGLPTGQFTRRSTCRSILGLVACQQVTLASCKLKQVTCYKCDFDTQSHSLITRRGNLTHIGRLQAGRFSDLDVRFLSAIYQDRYYQFDKLKDWAYQWDLTSELNEQGKALLRGWRVPPTKIKQHTATVNGSQDSWYAVCRVVCHSSA